MHTFTAENTVADIVVANPALSRVFESVGLDYCCGGKKTVSAACREHGLDSTDVMHRLEAAVREAAKGPATVDPNAMTLAELADHIETTHHAWLRRELPRLDALTTKVSSVHGARDSRLEHVRGTFLGLSAELEMHMAKEEQILFPLIRQMERDGGDARMMIAGPIEVMELEHEDAGQALRSLRELTDGFTPPEWACNTYRAMIHALAELEADLHLHIHKENNVLFPRALGK